MSMKPRTINSFQTSWRKRIIVIACHAIILSFIYPMTAAAQRVETYNAGCAIVDQRFTIGATLKNTGTNMFYQWQYLDVISPQMLKSKILCLHLDEMCPC